MGAIHADDARDGTYCVLVSRISVAALRDRPRRGAARAAHDGLVRNVTKAHHGSEVAGAADGLSFTFRGVRQALRCAVAVQQALSPTGGGERRPRMGLHVGEMTVCNGVLEGPVLALATELLSARNTIQPAGTQATFDQLTEPTELQARALALINEHVPKLT